jgi:hypothetical protein
MMRRWLRAWWLFLIAVDQLAYVWLACWLFVLANRAEPDPDETISSAVGRNAVAGRRWALIAERVIDRIFGRGHCRDSIGT